MAVPLYLIFGRFNPPTIGHEMLFRTAMSHAQQHGGKVVVFVSQTEDRKNPIPYQEKVAVIKKSIPQLTIGPKSVRTPSEALTWAFDNGYRDITLLVGEDREEGFSKMVGVWQKDADPKQLAVVRMKALPRKGNMDASKVSGTVARRLAQQGDTKNLKKILISGAQDAPTIRRFVSLIQARLGKLKEMIMPKKTRKLQEDTGLDVETIDPQVARVVERLISNSSWLSEDTPAEVPTSEPDNVGILDYKERVPEDKPKNKSVVVMYPDRRLKYDMINKAKKEQGDNTQPHHFRLQRTPQMHTK
jgi:nicotinic acid mononucleotide adenylyltransferase